jgi:hypothetical protein
VWTAEQISSDHRRYLADLPLTSSIDLAAAGDLLAFHGSPLSADDLVDVQSHAAYAVVSTGGTQIDVEFRQVAVDSEAVSASVRRSDMPHGDWWLGLRRLD